MILGVDPVAHIEAITVELRSNPAQHVRVLTRENLLDVLVAAESVRAVADGRSHPVRPHPRARACRSASWCSNTGCSDGKASPR